MKLIIVSVVCFLLVACSTLSKNYVKNGSFVLDGGTNGEKSWNTSLEFKRLSWYQELTLSFDVMYARVGGSDPFYNWFSESEKEMVGECLDFYVTLLYAMDDSKIAAKHYIAQMDSYGYKKVLLPTFSSYVKNHPGFEMNSLKLYKILGFCRKEKIAKDLNIRFPNFEDQRM